MTRTGALWPTRTKPKSAAQRTEDTQMRKAYAAKAKAFGAALNYAQRGFEEIATGGGFSAYYKKFPDLGVHVLVTDKDDLAPRTWDEQVTGGLYAENGLWLGTMNAKDSDDLFGRIARGEWDSTEIKP